MARYVLTVKLGTNGASISARSVETGEVFSILIQGPPKVVQAYLKVLEASPDIEIKYE